MRRFALLCLALSLPATALAVPLEFNHQGRLYDGLGVPLAGTHDLSFALYDDSATPTSLWSETHTGVDTANGYFSVQLGSVSSLDTDAFDGSSLWMGVTVDTGTEIPTRIAIVSVPYAIRALESDHADSADSADTATNVDGGVVNATEVQINGTTVIDSSGALVTSDLPAHQHDAADVSSGSFIIDRLPVGTGATEVAAGDHLHGLDQLTGKITAAQLPVDFDTQVQSVVGAHYTDSDAISAVGAHYSDADAISAVGAHYSDSDAISAVGPHYSDSDAVSAIEGAGSLDLPAGATIGGTSVGTAYSDFGAMAQAMGFPNTNTDSDGGITGGNSTGPWLLVGGNASSQTGNDLCATLGMEAVGKMWNDVGNGGRQWENTDQACEDTNSVGEWYFDCLVMCAP